MAKEIINKMKIQHSEWEKIFANEATDKRLMSKIYKQFMQLNSKKKIKIKTHNYKIDRIPKQTFLQRRHTDDQQTCIRCSTLLIVREMQIRSTMKYHLMPVRMAIIKKSIDNKCQNIAFIYFYSILFIMCYYIIIQEIIYFYSIQKREPS